MTQRLPHYCHATDCSVRVPPAMFMCRRHWRMVPPKMRAKIWKHYVPGQETRMDPSDKYLKWATRAVQAVAEREATLKPTTGDGHG